MRTLLLSTAVALLAACGAGEEDRTDAVGVATTPEIAVRNLALSVREGNRELFLGGFSATPHQQDLLDGAFAFMDATRRLRDAVVQEWGRTGWELFERSPGARLELKNLTDEQLERMKIAVDGDRAVATLDGEDPLTLLRIDGVWKIDGSSVVPTGNAESDPRPGDQMRRLALVVEWARERVGEAGLSAEKLDEELGARFVMAIRGSVDLPEAREPEAVEEEEDR